MERNKHDDHCEWWIWNQVSETIIASRCLPGEKDIVSIF